MLAASQRVAALFRRKLVQIGDRGSSADCPKHARRVPALDVICVGIALTKFRPHFIAYQVGAHRFRARHVERFTFRKHGRYQHGTRMSAQRNVVEIERVCCGAVDEGGIAARCLAGTENNARLTGLRFPVVHELTDNFYYRFMLPRDHGGNGIDEPGLHNPDCLFGERPERRVGDKAG